MSRLVLHYAPRSRASRIVWLLEEAGVPYELQMYDLQKGTHKDPAYLAINPDGKVPALVDRGENGNEQRVVTESAAICLYVADLFPESKLAPVPTASERAAYLSWTIYEAAAIEPALSDVAFPRQKDPPASAVGWPKLDAVIARVAQQLERGPWLLGEQFRAADVMVGSMLQWTRQWGKLPPNAPVDRYLARLAERPAFQRAQQKEASLAR